MNNSGEADVLIVGDSCMDKFTYGTSSRLCPDTPAPVFKPIKTTHNSGMAGNVFTNIESFKVGCDLLTNITKTTKHRYVDAKTNHTFLRIDEQDEIPRVPKEWRDGYDLSLYKAIVIADYNKGFLEKEDIEFFCDNHDTVFLDTKKKLGDFCKNVKFIKINELEYELLKDDIELDKWVNKLIVTLGNEGCKLYTEEGFEQFGVERVDVFDVSGAGDTFQAGLVVKYLETENIKESIKYANDCASEIVQQRGVTFPENHIEVKI
jgi:D-beta-D-heptose 7-phosphate kinase/D-beta-D-heptose 1-phosphate adenosyltransferase